MDTINKIMMLLEKNNLSQKELTDYLELDKSTFSAWKNGKSKSFYKYLSQIANFLNVSTDYLLGKNLKSDIDIRRIARARNKMPEEDQERMMKVLELTFSKYFNDDFIDDDIDE